MNFYKFYKNKMDSVNRFYYKKSRLQQLKGFCSVIEYGSVKKAGNKLNLDPSTISLQVKSLEIDFGTKLIYKSNNKILPTENGILLYKKASEIIKNVDELFSSFVISKNKKYLNIAIQPIFIEYFIEIFYKYIDKYKGIDINIYIKDEIFDLILKEEIDLFFCDNISNIPTSNEIEIKKIKEFKYVNVYSSNMDKDNNNCIKFHNCLTFSILENIVKNQNISMFVPEICLTDNDFLIEKTDIKGFLFCVYKKNNNININNFLKILDFYN